MAGMDVSMNYPQLVALNSLQQTLERNIPGIDKKDVFDILDRASKSEVDIISGKAKEILTRYYRK